MVAATLESLNAPLVLRELSMPSPGIGQVHVRVLAAGICGAQLQEIRGEKGNEKYLPHLLGHEGCGEVLAVGKGVKTVSAGCRVVLHWRKGDGMDVNGGWPYLDTDRDQPIEFGGGPIHTFCTEAIISENRCTAVPSGTPSDLCCLLGCALSTALGVLENDAKLRMGESVLVVGCGGVGLSLIQGAVMLGCSVNATDRNEKPDCCGVRILPWDIMDGGCAAVAHWDCIIDTTGNTEFIEDALGWLNPGGRFILVGQPAPGEYLRINGRQLFDGTGATIIASQGGQFNPARDLPRYIRLWRAGLLQAAGITHRLPIERINEGLDLMRDGKAGRVIIEMQHDPR